MNKTSAEEVSIQALLPVSTALGESMAAGPPVVAVAFGIACDAGIGVTAGNWACETEIFVHPTPTIRQNAID
jgi:hypothetical protein